MKKVYSTPDSLMAGHIKNILAQQGIECMVRQPMLSIAFGGVPPTETWSQVWISDDSRYKDALEVVEAAMAVEISEDSTWTCPKCSEEIDGQFSVCWQCGTDEKDLRF